MVEFIGYLTINLLRAEHLLSMGVTASKTNPYCVLQLGGQKVTSKVATDTTNPVWKEKVMLCWDGVAELHVDVFSSDEHMGGGTLGLSYLLDAEADDDNDNDDDDSLDGCSPGGRGGKSDSVNSQFPDLGSIGESPEDGSEDDCGSPPQSTQR